MDLAAVFGPTEEEITTIIEGCAPPNFAFAAIVYPNSPSSFSCPNILNPPFPLLGFFLSFLYTIEHFSPINPRILQALVSSFAKKTC